MLAQGKDGSLPSVPRSKGCLTCVSRKTGCDGRRPTCRACEARKQTCGGYRRDQVVFLNEGWRSLGVAASKSRGTNSNNISTAQSAPNSPAPTTCSETPGTNRTTSLALYSSPDIDRTNLHIAYFLASFGTRPCQALGSLGHLFRYYLTMISSNNLHQRHQESLSSPTTPVLYAVDALAYCHFGTANADSASVRRSFDMYGMALQSMSARTTRMNRAGSDFYHISDQDWQHFAFFCLVMAFWEMKMSPASRNWEDHLRCLAAAILLRGPDQLYSKTNYQLLASSRMLIVLQTLSAREPNDWQQCSPIRSAWLDEVKLALGEAQLPNFSHDYDLYHGVDALMTDVTTIVSTTSQFDQLLRDRSTAIAEDSSQRLVHLHNKVEIILSQNESRLARWRTKVCEISLSSWLSYHQDTVTDPIADEFWNSMIGSNVRSCFDTVLTFRTMLEYHSVTLYWTVIMSLRLLLSDMLAFMARIGMDGIHPSIRDKIEDHRMQLMKYALNVLQTICYATHAENRAVGPFVVTTAFQLTHAVLERERNFLQAEAAGSNQDRIQKCDGLKAVAARYLDCAVSASFKAVLDTAACLIRLFPIKYRRLALLLLCKQRVDSPGAIIHTRRDIGALEGRAVLDMRQCLGKAPARIVLGVMGNDPATISE
ncbi:hypothetical protein NM208_g11011 [Fusarium decemcellulare]|uniref:Uncharacterized protein n=1 Tax=Fusarium decemcellulare TaxID=57161 RepID=A0ACC1RVU5_9HYPO|nr:hypothetical protein NM208_g11011 [Fusarium decemcellulare]